MEEGRAGRGVSDVTSEYSFAQYCPFLPTAQFRSSHLAKLVEVGDLLLSQSDPVVKVETPDVVLHRLPHLLPRVPLLQSLRRREAKGLSVTGEDLSDQGGVVHELLGDATDVHAGSAEAPGGPGGGGLDEIEDGNLGTKLGSLLGSGHTWG